MRDAREVALAIDSGCSLDDAVPIIEADRRAAKLEALEELRKRVFDGAVPYHGGDTWGQHLDRLRSELEKAGAIASAGQSSE